MNVTVRLFAGVRERIGAEATDVTLPASATVSELKTAVAERHPEAAALVARSAVAVNGEYVAADRHVTAADEIALIPPVSGG